MEKESLTNSLTVLTEQISKNKKIVLIYYTTNEKNKIITDIDYNIVLDLESITSNLDLLMQIVANMELIKTLFSKTAIKFNYTIRSLESLYTSKKELKKYTKSQIIYQRKELLEETKLSKIKVRK